MVAEKLLDETRLAHAGGPENREQLAGAITDGLLEGVRESPAFALPSDHGRVQAPRWNPHWVQDLDETVCVADGVCGDRLADELPCRLVEQDLAGGRRTRQVRGAAKRLTGGSWTASCVGAGDDLSGADPHAKGEIERALDRQLGGERGEDSANLRGGTYAS